MCEVKVIGVVHSQIEEPGGPEEMRDRESLIEIKPEFSDGLQGIETNEHLQVLFYLHRAEDYDLIGPRRHGEERGVFASRSPRRPSPLGSTVVRLLARESNQLRVKGLDAVDGTPVLDLKPFAASYDTPDPE